jgi:hypothetical protein
MLDGEPVMRRGHVGAVALQLALRRRHPDDMHLGGLAIAGLHRHRAGNAAHSHGRVGGDSVGLTEFVACRIFLAVDIILAALASFGEGTGAGGERRRSGKREGDTDFYPAHGSSSILNSSSLQASAAPAD